VSIYQEFLLVLKLICVAYLGRDFPHTLPLPALDPVALTFESESAQYPVKGMASDLEWLFLTSANVGWARLGPSNRLLHPSYYHEIHCLRMLNQALFRVESPYTTMAHSRHCLHYLRVLTLCNADVVLEPVTRVNASVFEWDVAQATHTCRDWSALYNSMEKNWEDWKVYNESHPL
jgi:hypothetical protein